MTLKEYTAFITSVEQGSISKAAIVLGSTQSALTHLIINMEKEFVRKKSGKMNGI